MNRFVFALSAAVVFATFSSAFGQFDDQWARFQKNAGMLSAGTISAQDVEVDFSVGDLDLDGRLDLVVVRKQPFTSSGKRTNVLLMNISGVLTDQTAQYAAASTVIGDNGFLTATNDRDAAITDVDQDGWLDVVTATTLSDGDPKWLGHPRVYRNLGTGASWNGLVHDEPRFPQLLQFGTGSPENPRFTVLAAGDVTNDGYPDLYFVDHDSSGAGGSGQPANKDLDDRLLINDGAGYFVDRSYPSMTAVMLKSAYGNGAAMADFDLDGRLDIVKVTSLNAPQYGAIAYNDGPAVGTFSTFDVVQSFAPYYVAAGDLNQDGRPDLVFPDNGSDRYRLNQGLAAGIASWSSAQTFDFLFGGDAGFSNSTSIADLDQDGWNDVLISDVDVDIAGCNRRLNIYHNRGGVVGGPIVLREERQSTSSSGWVGVVGMVEANLKGTYDVGVIDIDGDGADELVIGRCNGTDVWENQVPTCSFVNPYSVGCAGSGGFTPKLEVQGALCAGTSGSLSISEGLGGSFALVVFGLQPGATSLPGGCVLAVSPLLPFSLSVPLGGAGAGNGAAQLTGNMPGGAPATVTIQAFVAEPSTPHGYSATAGVLVSTF